ncbi:MAG: efflux RND transporter periplasmic adaptor subunit, partial [Candidatus Saccharimonadales bacterium]
PMADSQPPWWKWTLTLALAVVVGAGGAYGWSSLGQGPTRASAADSSHDNTTAHDGDSTDASRLNVKVVHPKRGGLSRTTTQPGVLHAFEYADLYAKASGYLTAQVVDIGDTVERGQVLAEIFDPERKQAAEEGAAAVEQAKAQVRQAEAKVTISEAAVASAKAVLHQKQAQVGKSTAATKFREKEYVRFIELTQQRAVDFRLSDEKQKEYESALAAEKEAQAAVEGAEAGLAEAVAEVVTAKANIAAARANVHLLKAREESANILVQYLQLVSPYDGVVTNRNYHRGAFVQSAEHGQSQPVLSVARTDRMRVVVYVPDRDVPLLDRGDEAVVRVDALDGEEFRGTVSRYSQYEDPANRTMRTEIDLENPTGRLRQGMYGGVTILLERPSEHLTVPSGALHERSAGGSGKLYVVHGHVARETDVRVGRDNGIRAEIIDGLSQDDLVVVSYSGSLEDGEPVEAETAGEGS